MQRFLFGILRTKVWAVCTVLELAATTVAVAQEAAEKPIRNGKFEQGETTNTTPANWSGRPPGTWTWQTHPDQTQNRYIALSSDKPGTKPLLLQQNLPLSPGLSYTTAYDVKAPSDCDYRVYVEWWHLDGGCAGAANTKWRKGTGHWERESFRFTYPERMKPPYIVLQLQAPGTAAFDNVQIYRPVPEPPREGCVFSADFESGPSHWEFPRGAEVRKGDTPSGKAFLAVTSRTKGHDPTAVVRGIPTKPGKTYRLAYRIRSGGGSAEVTGYQYFRVSTSWERLIKDGRNYGTVAQRDGMAWQDCFASWQRRSLLFQAPHKPTSGLVLSCQVRGPGSVHIDEIELREEAGAAGEPPLELVLTTPNYRDTFFPGQPADTIRGFVLVTGTGVAKVRISLEVQAVPPVEHPVTATSAPFPTLPFEFTSPPATVCAEAFDAGGRTLGKLRHNVMLAPPPVAGTRPVTMGPDGIFLLNGEQPVFPVGLWRCPSTMAQLTELAQAGFNVVRCSQDPDTFAKIAKSGLLAMVQIAKNPPADGPDRAAWEERARQRLPVLQASPALLGYYLTDEPLWNGQPLQPLIDAYDFHRKLDPYHPIWINMAPRGTIPDLARYNRACDISGADIYPVPEGGSHSDLDDRNLSCVGAYTKRMRASVANAKPVWMTLQGFAWGHLSNGRSPDAVYPDRHQSRFMAYDAIIHGAAGIMYWGTHAIADPEFWGVLLDTARDLHAVSGILVGETDTSPAAKADNPSVKLLHKRAAIDTVLSNATHSFLIAANTTGKPAKTTIKVPFADGKLTAYDGPFADTARREVLVSNGRIAEEFGAYDVRIYADTMYLPRPARVIPAPKSNLPDGRSLAEAARFRRDSSPYSGTASWIWHPGTSGKALATCVLRRTIALPTAPQQAELLATADDTFTLTINGRTADSDDSWSRMRRQNVTELLQSGPNLITVKARDGGIAPCGFLADLRITLTDGQVLTVLTDEKWRAAPTPKPNWQTPDFDDTAWPRAEIIAPYGQGPWRNRLIIEPAE